MKNYRFCDIIYFVLKKRGASITRSAYIRGNTVYNLNLLNHVFVSHEDLNEVPHGTAVANYIHMRTNNV